MNWHDIINGFFELGGSFAVCIGIHAIWKDRGYAGGHIIQILYFIVLSSWRMFYFGSLHQSFSRNAEGFRFLANVTYFGLMLYYGRKR
jgi:hypothetical protein